MAVEHVLTFFLLLVLRTVGKVTIILFSLSKGGTMASIVPPGYVPAVNDISKWLVIEDFVLFQNGRQQEFLVRESTRVSIVKIIFIWI